jgi:hypothetical protein
MYYSYKFFFEKSLKIQSLCVYYVINCIVLLFEFSNVKKDDDLILNNRKSSACLLYYLVDVHGLHHGNAIV